MRSIVFVTNPIAVLDVYCSMGGFDYNFLVLVDHIVMAKDFTITFGWGIMVNPGLTIR